MIHKDEEKLIGRNMSSENVVKNLFKTDGLLNSMKSDVIFTEYQYDNNQYQQPPQQQQSLFPPNGLSLGGCCSCKYIVILIIFIVIFTSVMSFANK